MCSFLVTNIPDVDLERANHFQKFRGPDHTRITKFGDVTFVHNLLSINGAFTTQPFIDDELACVYNGEIYNSSDYGAFESDGLCLLPAYRALGPRFVRELDGEFAIVIFDRSNATLFISADVLGTKPIHYSFRGEHFGVASYSSALEAIGFSPIIRLEPNNMPHREPIESKRNHL